MTATSIADAAVQPATRATPISVLLMPSYLGAQIAEVEHLVEQHQKGLGSFGQLRLARAVECLRLLTEPSVNTVVSTMKGLDPTMQALVSDLVLALAHAGTGRQHLAIALRKLIEGRS